jgi:hypothetical protein
VPKTFIFLLAFALASGFALSRSRFASGSHSLRSSRGLLLSYVFIDDLSRHALRFSSIAPPQKFKDTAFDNPVMNFLAAFDFTNAHTDFRPQPREKFQEVAILRPDHGQKLPPQMGRQSRTLCIRGNRQRQVAALKNGGRDEVAKVGFIHGVHHRAGFHGFLMDYFV